jgi:P27 family predicted phage terminase small subunit
MGKPGPSPKPTQLKKLAGNPGKRKLNDAEPQFEAPGRMLNVPDYLDKRAAEIWRELGRLLLSAGLFTVVDKYALAMFCVAAGRWMEAEAKLKESGPVLLSKATGNLYQNPYLHVANRAWDQMRQMFGEFGLTPAERSRLQVMVEEQEPSLAEQLFALAGTMSDGD